MISPRTNRWSQIEISDLTDAHTKGELSTEEGANRWALAHNRSPEAMYRKLVELGRERPRVTKGETTLSDADLVVEVAKRLAAKGTSSDNASALINLLKGALAT